MAYFSFRANGGDALTALPDDLKLKGFLIVKSMFDPSISRQTM